MLYVTSYEIPEKKSEQYAVAFCNGETLYVSEEEFFEFSLYDIGAEIDMTFEELNYKINVKRAFYNGVTFTSSSRKSEGQVMEHLKQKGYSEECSLEAIERLREEDYINDELFAERYIIKASDSKIISLQSLKYELKSKYVDESIINKCIEKAGFSEYDMVKKAYEKKVRLGEKDRRKIYSYLFGKGFSSDNIRKILGDFED